MPDNTLEKQLGGIVCGVDEAGRGSLAGGVFAAAVVLTPQAMEWPLNDSKKLSAHKRRELAEDIWGQCAVGLGIASVAEIDALNILHATMLAMRRAVLALPLTPDAALIDGNRLPVGLPCAAQVVVGGDARSLSIAAASIIAKTARDASMEALHCLYPAYGFDRHAGYGTAAHLEALRADGATPQHRRSFAPVRNMLAISTP